MIADILYILWIGFQVLVAVIIVLVCVMLIWCLWIGKWLEYRKAKSAIIPWVESYKKRCTAQNRFVVTVETLQDSFREFDTPTIERVWKILIDKRAIQQDPIDNEWCIR